MSGLATGIFSKFIDYLFETGAITVPKDFHGQCSVINVMLGNDISGVISTIIDYAIDSASEAQFKIECSDQTLEDLLELWLEKININVNGIPTGLQELSKEYYKERWAGSSLCLLRVSNWKKIKIGSNEIKVPTTLWFVNGSSIYIKRPKNYTLGSDNYFLDEEFKKSLPSKKNENIMVQKPTGRWFTKYPIPYLIKRGVYKNWKALEVLSSKSDEVLTKVLPYLFLIEKGDKDVFLQKDVDYSDTELKTMVNNFKDAVEKYKYKKAKIPAVGLPFDQKFSHLIPDLKNILSEELYKQGYRAIISGLGFVTVVQGIGESRKEEVINPKPFIAEVNAGVDGFKSILMDIIRLIISENKIEHRKLFSTNNTLKIVNTPLKINTALIFDSIRSAYVYGTISVQTYQEILGIDPDQELERMKKEWSDGLRDIYYPHVIQNTEKDPDTNVSIPPTTKKQIEKKNEKEKKPSTMNKSEIDLEIAPYDVNNPPAFLKKYPKGAQKVFIEVFNKNLPKGEDYAFPVAYTALKRWMKKHGYKKVNDKWVKSELEIQ